MSIENFEKKSFDRLKLYYQIWHSESKPKGIICLVHGLGEHCGRYQQWAEMLNKADYSVLSFDLRGHGKSEGQRGHVSSFNEFLKDVDLLLEEANNRFPDSSHFLYGHSLGAIILWNYVLLKNPQISGIVLSALDHRNALEEQKGKVMLSKILGSVVPRMSLSSGLEPSSISRDSQVVSAYVNDPMVHNRITVGFAKSSMDAIAWSLKHMDEWSIPVLIMHGEKDMLGYVSGSIEFAGAIKCDSTLKVWEGLYHEIHNEPEKELVFMYLCEWLDKHLTH